jgi:hypothetical protein
VTELKHGDKVLAARTVVKPAYVRKNGEQVPERVKTTLREGTLSGRVRGGWDVMWTGGMRRRYHEHYFDHEITKLGTNPLLVNNK